MSHRALGPQFFHESAPENRPSIEKEGLRPSDEGTWLFSDHSRLTPGFDHWQVDPPGAVHHGSEASIEWEPDDPVHVTYDPVPPSRLKRISRG